MYPQVLVNVKVRKGFDLQANGAVQAALKAAEPALKARAVCCCAPREPSR